jgi:hypothetical protein
MGRTLDVTARVFVSLAVAGLAMVAFPPADGTATVSVAVVALVFAAVVRLGDHGVVLLAQQLVTRPPTADATPPVLAGRITDPAHHPLRPRAPGLA